MVFNINEEQQQALEKEAEEINSRSATPAVEEQAPEEVQTEEAEVATEAEAENTETVEEGESKKGFQARVRELNQRAKAAEERAQTAERQLLERSVPQQVAPPYDPNEPLVAPGEEIDGNELNRRIAIRDQRILQQANANAHAMQQRSAAASRLSNEAKEVITKYPELDPESESFDEELSEIVTEATDAYWRKNPGEASIKNFVDKLMKPYKGAATREIGKARENIAKQVSQAALRPTSVRREEKAATDLSIEELEAKLGIVQS